MKTLAKLISAELLDDAEALVSAAFAGLLLGSVGHDLLMSMPCPVAIVPQGVSAL